MRYIGGYIGFALGFVVSLARGVQPPRTTVPICCSSFLPASALAMRCALSRQAALAASQPAVYGGHSSWPQQLATAGRSTAGAPTNRGLLCPVRSSAPRAQFLTGTRSATNLTSCLRASRVIHHRTLTTLVRAPVTFFDTTPVGRILNRFSKVRCAALLVVWWAGGAVDTAQRSGQGLECKIQGVINGSAAFALGVHE
jgi:hypothetical protein